MRFKNAFHKTDDDFLKLEKKSGSTIVVVYFRENKLYLAWSGDSRAVLEMSGAVGYATKDHKPFSDKDRIEKAGYPVIAWQDSPADKPFWTIPLMKNDQWKKSVVNISKQKGNGYEYYFYNDIKHILHVDLGGRGQLNVPRAIGDKILKRDFPGMTIVDPDIKTDIELTKKHGFLILACDGVWDVLSNEEAIQIVGWALKKNNKSIKPDPRDLEEREEDGNDVGVQYAARKLRDKAFKKGSTDNISVIIVKFMWTQNKK